MDYMLQTIAAVKEVDKQSQPGALELEVRTSYRFILNYSHRQEVKQLAEALIAVAELDTEDVNDTEDMKATISAAVISAKQGVGQMLAGQYQTAYSFSVDIAQAKLLLILQRHKINAISTGKKGSKHDYRMLFDQVRGRHSVGT